MKKSRLLIIGLVIALLLVGSAYAAWTEQVDLTVNASSGDMGVEISKVDIGDVSDYVEFDQDSVIISEDKKSAMVSVENLYPEASVNVAFEITNTGTLPIIMDKAVQNKIEVIDAKTNKKMDDSLLAALKMTYKGYVYDENGKMITKVGQTAVWGNADSQAFLYNNDKVIEPNQKLVLEMEIAMDDRAENETENKLFRFSITPLFVQAN